MLRKYIPLIALTVGALLLVSPAPLRAWDLASAGLARTIIPVGTVPVIPIVRSDLDGDGNLEQLSLANGTAAILSGGMIIWQSPAGWQVIQAEITDLDHDGAPEATLLVWRPFRPWPVDQWLPHGGRIDNFHDSEGNSCHIILIGWRNGQYQEVWAGSALAEPVKSFAVGDLDGDHRQELLALEGTYDRQRSAPARTLKVWEWNGFGFTAVSSLNGTFDKMALVRDNEGHGLILVP